MSIGCGPTSPSPIWGRSYDTFASRLNAPSRRNIATYRNTTEAINAVMYTLLTEFRDGAGNATWQMPSNGVRTTCSPPDLGSPANRWVIETVGDV